MNSKVFLFLVALLAIGCTQTEKRFELLKPENTGVTFQNKLTDTPQMNIFTYLYFYNGGGVAAGDLNGDGLADLYFTANQDSNRLYLNKGGFQFEDITETSQTFGGKGWTTGVTMADVNADGLLDIYVSQLGDYKNIRGKNILYINLGNDESGRPRFEDQAKKWNLDLVGFSTQAAFFDYDLDGDLDMFMLNHSVHSNGTFGRSGIRNVTHPLAGDKLLRNDGEKFTDVTAESGIYSSALGYGLGVGIGDVNWDGYPDIYVGNDFHEDDYLYMNKGDGTFEERLHASMGHTSRFSMGNDIGDINNDGLNDILSLDMLPADPYTLKTAAGEDAYDVYTMKLGFGYKDQFARNSLQLNQGNGKFSDIALMSGVFATDWSWSGLIADFDLDGLNDIHISNGIKRRSNDNDYINFISNDAIQNRLEGDLSDEDLNLVEKMPVIKIPNYAFRNIGNLSFQDVSEEWGLNQSSFSNGSAYVDLDNDGDLDLVINNIDQEAFLYRNNTISADKRENNFIKIQFRGDSLNTYGLGSKVIIPLDSGKIIRELFTTRGYQSSVSPELVIGLGNRSTLDSLMVIWPDHSYQVLRDVQANQLVVVEKKNAADRIQFKGHEVGLLTDVSDTISISFSHNENNFVEFNREGLVPHMASTEGPRIAVGDVNGDGLDDLYVCGAKHQTGGLLIQHNKSFVLSNQQTFRQDSLKEDTDARFIDIDNDGDLDLTVLSGGNEFRNESPELAPRLYLNDGNGIFTKQVNAFDGIFVTGSCLRFFDIDGDGDQDVFVGGRVIPWKYGYSPSSYLLINDGTGVFSDATDQFAPGLRQAGMVKDAQWVDINSDQQIDLVIVGEWMPVSFYINNNNHWSYQEIESLQYSNGWWNVVQCMDIDNDGDIDILAGNLGLNSKLQASVNKPVTAYLNDFDNNGKTEDLIFHYIGEKEVLLPTRDEITKQLVQIKKKYLSYSEYAKASPREIVDPKLLDEAVRLTAYEFRSGYFVNDGKMNFQFKAFPKEVQFAPVNSITTTDINNDKFEDIILAGNYFESNIQLGKYDASYGSLLTNNGKGSFEYMLNQKSGLYITGQVRDIKKVQVEGIEYFMFARNNDRIQVFKVNRK